MDLRDNERQRKEIQRETGGGERQGGEWNKEVRRVGYGKGEDWENGWWRRRGGRQGGGRGRKEGRKKKRKNHKVKKRGRHSNHKQNTTTTGGSRDERAGLGLLCSGSVGTSAAETLGHHSREGGGALLTPDATRGWKGRGTTGGERERGKVCGEGVVSPYGRPLTREGGRMGRKEALGPRG